MVHRFHYLKYALSLVLVLIGIKVGLVFFNDVGWVSFKIPTAWSLAATLGLLLAGVLYSLHKTRIRTPTIERRSAAFCRPGALASGRFCKPGVNPGYFATISPWLPRVGAVS